MLRIRKIILDKRILDFLWTIIGLGIIVWTIIPVLYLTKYTYPVQDDFHVASQMRMYSEQGYSCFTGAMHQMIGDYKIFMGAYSANFLVYFVGGIIDCAQPGMMIYEISSIVVFCISLFLFVRSICVYLFQIDKRAVIPLYACVLTMVNNVFYYADHEDYYWLETSVMYLTIMSFMLISLYMAIRLSCITEKKHYKTFLILSCIIAFLGSGANLSLTFMNCAFHFMIFAFLWLKDDSEKKHFPPLFAALIGTFINGIAPGNYVRKGSVDGIHEIVNSVYFSCRFVFERLEKIWRQPIFIIVVIIMILLLMLHSEGITDIRLGYKWPMLVALGMYFICAAVTFPAILGYGYEILLICNRLLFIIDVMIYLTTFFMCIYLTGWMRYKYDKDILMKVKKDACILTAFIILISLAKLRDNEWRWTPVIRMYREINSGRMKEFSNYVRGVYSELENSKDNIVRINVDRVEDKCCLIDPLFFYGEHDDEQSFYYDDAIVRFYKKDSLILIDQQAEKE